MGFMDLFRKQKTPEEELADAEKRRDDANNALDNIRQRLDVEVDIARVKAETELERKRLQNPKAEYERREKLSVESMQQAEPIKKRR